MIRARVFVALTCLELLLFSGLLLHGRHLAAERATTELPANRRLAQVLQLSDCSIWTEARYTRHPSQADRFAAFQESPSAFEHFPAGSIVGPPTRQP